jgi:hypothetical protein
MNPVCVRAQSKSRKRQLACQSQIGVFTKEGLRMPMSWNLLQGQKAVVRLYWTFGKAMEFAQTAAAEIAAADDSWLLISARSFLL